MRVFLRWTLTAVLLGGTLALTWGVLGELFIEYAREQGYYANPSQKVDAVMTAFSNFVSHTWFIASLTFVAGGALGSWLDLVLKRREHPGAKIDREALAQEAEKLSAEIAALAGELEGQHTVAWEDDAHAMRVPGTFPTRARSANVRAKLAERFGEKFYARAWGVIARAHKCINLDRGDLWQLSHGISDRDVTTYAQILAKIAVELRHPFPDLPLTNRIAEEHASRQAAQTGSPPPPSIEQKTPQ